MVLLRNLAWGAALLMVGPTGLRDLHAQDAGTNSLTLINGAVLRGTLGELSSSGVVFAVGSASRFYPWVALAPGSRFHYDLRYRANLSGYLAGADSASLTNAPESGYDPLNPEAVTSAGGAAPSGPEAPSAARVVWDSSPPFLPASVRGFEEIAEAGGVFWSVRLGTARDDVAVFAWEPGDAPRLTTGSRGDGRATTETRPAGGEGVWTTERRVFPVSFGAQAGQVAVSWRITRVDAGWRRQVQLEVSGPASFRLEGEVHDWSAPDVLLVPASPYGEPSLRWTVAVESNAAALVGEARMGRWRMSPDAASPVQVSVEDAEGAKLADAALTLAHAEDPAAWPVRVALSAGKPGSAYVARAKADFGAWLGSATSEYRFVLPDPDKL